jgi:hypothetical protein
MLDRYLSVPEYFCKFPPYTLTPGLHVLHVQGFKSRRRLTVQNVSFKVKIVESVPLDSESLFSMIIAVSKRI